MPTPEEIMAKCEALAALASELKTEIAALAEENAVLWRHARNGGVQQKTCARPECGKTFTTTRPDKDYCSRPCAAAVAQREYRKRKAGPTSGSRTVTVEEAGKRLGIGRKLAYAAAKSGELPTIKVGRRLLVPVHALDELVAAPVRNPSTSSPPGKKR
jgi:excisionase family DNA binding protein